MPVGLGRDTPGAAHTSQSHVTSLEWAYPKPSLWSLTGYWRKLFHILNSSSFRRVPDPLKAMEQWSRTSQPSEGGTHLGQGSQASDGHHLVSH